MHLWYVVNACADMIFIFVFRRHSLGSIKSNQICGIVFTAISLSEFHRRNEYIDTPDCVCECGRGVQFFNCLFDCCGHV